MRLVAAIVAGCCIACGSGLERPRTDASDEVDTRDEVEVDTSEAETEVEPDVLDEIDVAEPNAETIEDVAEVGEATEVIEVTDTVEVEAEVVGPWRSALYPADWSAGFAVDGAALQDYSYAGYHRGTRSLGDGLGAGGVDGLTRFDVTDFGAVAAADASDSIDNSAAFQDAIDAADAAGGGLVFVPAGMYRIDRWLEVTSSRIVLRGEGPAASRLWFTRLSQLDANAHIRFVGDEVVTDDVPLASAASRFDDTLEVADASAFEVGEDVIIGEVLDEALLAELGMTTLWAADLGEWQPLYRRTVIGVDRTSDPHRIRVDVPLRAPLSLAHQASVRRVTGGLREVGIEHLGVANATPWNDAWKSEAVHAVAFVGVSDAWALDVASWVSPGAPLAGPGSGAHLVSGGLLVASSKRVTIAECSFENPENRRLGEGFLFEVRRSSEVLTRDCVAKNGGMNFNVGRGLGTSGSVWLRVQSAGSAAMPLGPGSLQTVAANNELHSLATANLFDGCTFDDGIDALNRGALRYGNGHAARETTLWNVRADEIVSMQYGLGYIIGSVGDTDLRTNPTLEGGGGTAPEDFVEGRGQGDLLVPASLYEDQLQRRLGR